MWGEDLQRLVAGVSATGRPRSLPPVVVSLQLLLRRPRLRLHTSVLVTNIMGCP